MDVSRRRSPLLLPVRVLLRWVIKALVLLFLGVRFLLRPRAVRYSLLVLLVGGGVAWKLLGEPALLTGSTGAVKRSPPGILISTSNRSTFTTNFTTRLESISPRSTNFLLMTRLSAS